MTKEFYVSEGYADSVRRKLDKFPYLKEAYKYWEQFLKEGGVPIESEKWKGENKEAKNEIKEIINEAETERKESETDTNNESKFKLK